MRSEWFKRQSSMRGRLALLLMLVVVMPMVVAGVFAWHVRTSSEVDGDGHVRQDEFETLPLLAVNRALATLEHALDDGARDLELRVSRLRGLDAASRADAFADLADGPDALVFVASGPAPAGERSDQAALRRALGALLDGRRAAAGYVMLPTPVPAVPTDATDGADGPEAASTAAAGPTSAPTAAGDVRGAGGTLHRFAVHPGPDGRMVAVAAPVSAERLLGAFGTTDGVERSLVLLDAEGRPTDAGGADGSDAPVVAHAAREVLASGAFQESGEDGAVAALPLRDPAGRPVAIALVRHAGLAAQPLLRRQAALLSSMLSILGLMSAVGVLAAVLMGALAPRLVWRDIRASTDFIFRSVDRLRELVQRNQGALDEQSRLTRRLLESVASLEAASQDILRTAGALAHKAEQSAWVSQTGHQKAELAQRSVLEVRERVMDLSSQMEELGRRCDEIGSLTSFINHLSSETNLLSINATIQAAGSGGGGGRQFTAMAGEIQRLADLSQDSTRDINHLVERIQVASRSTLNASKDGCDKVDNAKSCCEELESAFGRILRWVEETTQSARGIERSTEEQAGALQQVGQAIEQLEQRSRFTTGNFQDIVLAADELAELGSRMNETWKVG